MPATPSLGFNEHNLYQKCSIPPYLADFRRFLILADSYTPPEDGSDSRDIFLTPSIRTTSSPSIQAIATKYYPVLPGTTPYYLVLPGTTRHYQLLPDATLCDPGTAESILVPQNRFLYYRVDTGTTRSIPVLQNRSWYYRWDSCTTEVLQRSIPVLHSRSWYYRIDSWYYKVDPNTTESILVLQSRFL